MNFFLLFIAFLVLIGLKIYPIKFNNNYLSKDNETEERQNLIKSFDYYDYENDEPAKRETPEYKDIKIAFKVTEPQTSDRILINEARPQCRAYS